MSAKADLRYRQLRTLMSLQKSALTSNVGNTVHLGSGSTGFCWNGNELTVSCDPPIPGIMPGLISVGNPEDPLDPSETT